MPHSPFSIQRIPLLAVATVAVLATAFLALSPASPRPAAAEGLQGDVDCSGSIDSIDGLMILRAAAELEQAECVDAAGDLNCDDATDAIDALSVLRYVAALPPLPAPGKCTPIGDELPPEPTPTPAPTPVPPPSLHLEPTEIDLAEPNMLDIAMVPGSPDEAIVATQYGTLWRVSLSGAFPPVEFGDITDRMTRVSDEGLLGMTFAPGDPTTLYLDYTTGGAAQYSDEWKSGCSADEWAPEPHLDPKRNRISRFAVVNDALDLDSEEVIMDIPQPHCWHNASDLVFGPDGYLYIGVGDGGWIGGFYDGAPDTDDPYATILRIDVSGGGEGYSAPPDNPFVDGDGPNFDEIWAYGIRHPWRFNFDPATGDLWTTDTGENDWEEVDRIVRGGNYGWNVMEGTHCYPPFVNTCTEPAGHIPPHSEYAQQPDNAAGIGGFVYHGDDIPGLQGWYVFGDFLRPRIFAVHPDFPGDPIILYEGPLDPSCACLTSFAETPDGELLVTLAPRGDEPGEIMKVVAD